ncbi:sister chromatid cohesion 1 protein 4 isoform X1 [Aegilops tauschii subsp. strangulata]|nr:sister chromatid cohesion 1 protein 4 isoform X1 [Aegilops tauschii subsp. strangulata]
MFYSQFILAKKGPLGTIWIAAHLERKLRKNQVTDTDIGVSVDSIIFPEVPIALRLSSHLMVGVVRIYSRKVNYLFHDCSEALLKIKQAFRSAAVDLPPEESTAPYHSITLPETFHLDDFELPEAEFQGDIDHHVSSKEQITLQDNPERTGYSTSEFGLDERFGDGSSSHMGFDLEEELLLAKDHPIELESGDGIIVQGQSSLHPTDMDVDDTPSKDEEAEAYNKMDDEPSSSSKQNQSNADDLRNNIPNWTGYNLRTPDLNDMLFHNEDDAGPSSSYYHPSPFPCDDPASPASPEYVSAQAPATPGLMEETVPSRVHESPVLSPQRKASPSSNEEAAKVDNFAAPPSDFLHSAAANANDAVGAGMAEFGLAKPVQVESSGAVQENLAAPSSDILHSATANANDAVGAEMAEFSLVKPVQVESSGAAQENLAAPSSDLLHSAAANANDAASAEIAEFGLAKPVQVESSGAVAPPSDFLHSAAVNANDTVGAEMSEYRLTNPVQVESSGAVPENFAAPPSDFFHPAAAHANDTVGPEMAEFRLANPVQVESSGAVQHNFAVPPSDFLHQGAAHANDAVDSEMAEFRLSEPVQVESSRAIREMDFLRQHSATADMPPEPQTSNLVVNTEDIAVSGQTLPFKATMGSVPFVQNTSEPRANGSTETYVTGNPTHFNEGSVNMQGYNFLTSNVSVEPYPSGSTEPWVTGQQQQSFLSQASWGRPSGPTEPHVTGHPTHFNEGSGNVQGYNLHAPNVFLGHNLQEMPPGMTHSNISTAAFQQNTGTIPQYMSYNDRPNDMFTSNFPERERMLSAPYIGFHQTNDLGQLTAEKGITESDGSNKIGSLSSRKRHLEDSMPAPESRTTENLSSRPHGQRTTDAIPNDDDILASILVGRTPGLVLDSTPLPPNASTSKRQRLTPKTALTPKTRTPKRRVKMDDAMVIHADIIRQQLISTEDIRRIRRKAPCTRTEIWMIEKGSLEDDIFREPIFSCMHKDLNSLHYRTYESVSQFTVHNREPQRQVDMSETNPADNRNAGISGAEESAALDHQPHMVLPDTNNVDISGAKDSAALHHQLNMGLPDGAHNVGISGANDTAALDHQLNMGLPDGAHNVGISGANDSAALDLGLPDGAHNAGISGANDSAALDHQLHMGPPDGAQLDATLQEATDTVDGTAAFGLQMPSDERDNNIEKVTEFGDGKEIPLVDETNAAANITAHVDTLDKDCHQDASADMQRNTNADTPLFVQDDITHDSATITDAPDVALHSSGPACAQAVDGREGELSDIVRNDINTFEDREMPTSEITGLEFTEHAPGFPQPTEDDNAASAMGENSGLQGNNAGSFMDMDNTGHDFTDMDNTGHDFALKECSDFGSAIHGVDTDFLPYDDDGDFDEAIDLDDDDDEPNPDEFQSHDALSGWSSRTKGVARYLKTLFDEESGRGRKNVVIDHLVHGKSRKEASRMFFETLVLSTKDYIQVDQPIPFGLINVKPVSKLLKTDF